MLRARTWIFVTLLTFIAWLPPACNLEGDQGAWTGVRPAENLRGVAAEGGLLYAVGEGGTILQSASPWRRLPAPTTSDLNAVAARGQVAVAVGDDATVVVSCDGGATWTLRPEACPPGVRLYGVAATAGGLFVIVGEGGLVATSAAPAMPGSWTRRYPGTGEHLRGVAAAAGAVVAVGDCGTLAFSTDNGRTWGLRREAQLAGRNLAGVAASPEGSLFVVVGEAGLVATARAPWAGWTLRESGTREFLRGVAVSEAGEVFCVGERGTLLFSADSGLTWQKLPNPARRNLSGVAVCDGLAAVVGEGLLLAADRPQGGGPPLFASALPGLWAVHGGPKGIWAVGDGGAILAGAGGALHFEAPPRLEPYESLDGVWVEEEGERVWVKSDLGRLFSRQGKGAWGLELDCGVTAVTGCTVGQGREARTWLFAATQAGRVLSRNPDTGDWLEEPGVAALSRGRPLRAIWARGDDPGTREDETLVVSAGDRFSVLYLAGGGPWAALEPSAEECQALNIAGTEHLAALWGAGGCVFAVGEGSGGRGLIVRLDLGRPERPSLQATLVPGAPEGGRLLLTGVWAASPTQAVAVGSGGCVLRLEEGRWRRDVLPGREGPLEADLRAVWGASAEDVWIVGERGALLRYR